MGIRIIKDGQVVQEEQKSPLEQRLDRMENRITELENVILEIKTKVDGTKIGKKTNSK
jgi:uncharacterized coiled-coil protein SlyX